MHHSYARLAAMAALSCISMFILMSAMVDRFAQEEIDLMTRMLAAK